MIHTELESVSVCVWLIGNQSSFTSPNDKIRSILTFRWHKACSTMSLFYHSQRESHAFMHASLFVSQVEQKQCYVCFRTGKYWCSLWLSCNRYVSLQRISADGMMKNYRFSRPHTSLESSQGHVQFVRCLCVTIAAILIYRRTEYM